MPAGNIVYKSSSSSSPRVTKHTHNEPIYATVKKRLPKKGITRRGAVKRKGKPTKKNKSTRSSTVYVDLNLGSPKKSNKNTRIRSSRTPLKRMGSNGKLTSANNKGSSNKENVVNVMRNVKKATSLSKTQAQIMLKRAMNSN